MLSEYPIEDSLSDIRTMVQNRPLVFLTAPPGAGKTTVVPLALLQEPWLESKKILLLEPRRLAARTCARRMAALHQESIGETVGYRTRFDTAIGPRTRLEVVTEGILTRMLQKDPALTEYGLVIFDEFHERNLQSDLGLVLSHETQSVLRPNLRLLIMSATLNHHHLSKTFPDAPYLTCEGQMFPVETQYGEALDSTRLGRHIGSIIQRWLRQEEGNLLVFLPGAGEIRQVMKILQDSSLDSRILVAPLFGNLSPEAQDRAILPPPPGYRKVVLSTNIAETSVTIEGVRIVIDSGLVRVPRFDPRSGMSRLVTLPVSQESADQRRGRAGRLEAGICVRCWPEAQTHSLPRRLPPEILTADLTSLALDLAQWGVTSPETLPWPDVPPPGALAHARSLLVSLGALDDKWRISPHGRQMATLSMHPRLAHMVIQAESLQTQEFACDVAALLSERDALRGSSLSDQHDLRMIVDGLLSNESRLNIGRGAAIIRKASQSWKHDLGLPTTTPLPSDYIDVLGILLAWAYPDRLAKRDPDQRGRFRLVTGGFARFSEPTPLSQEEWLVIPDLDGAASISRIFLATPIHEAHIYEYFSEGIQDHEVVEWNDSTQAVLAQNRRQLGQILLKETQLTNPDQELRMSALVQGIRTKGLSCLPWTPPLRQWQARVQFLHRTLPSDQQWPDVSDETLLDSLETWLGPYLHHMSNLTQLKKLDLNWPLQALLSEAQRRSLETLAPSHLTVPTGSHIRLDYQSSKQPTLAVRLQEIFGMTETPTVANGQVPVLVHLLSPARRPVQVTNDLKSFWKNGYPEVKKELKGRYPKHAWPDDPLRAIPTRQTKKRSS